jgi:alpha-beta hydrolase superfamily lysophospholipase
MTETRLAAEDLTIPQQAGPSLRAWHWGVARPAATLVISHGLGEHGGCYGHVAELLAPRLGIDVLAFDYRGHGRSPGRRGVVDAYEDLVSDLRNVLDWLHGRHPSLPRFLLGHSNGGQVSLRALLDGQEVAGAIVSNPSLRLAMRVPVHKRWIGEVLRRVAPGVTLSATVADEAMTRDKAMLLGRWDDPLRHNRISAPLYFGMIEGGYSIAARAGEIQTPVLFLLGEDDPLVDAEFSREVFQSIGSVDKTLRVYRDTLHEPLNDINRAEVLDDIAAWLEPRIRTGR